jgi:hypothetical protein
VHAVLDHRGGHEARPQPPLLKPARMLVQILAENDVQM